MEIIGLTKHVTCAAKETCIAHKLARLRGRRIYNRLDLYRISEPDFNELRLKANISQTTEQIYDGTNLGDEFILRAMRVISEAICGEAPAGEGGGRGGGGSREF